MDIDRNLSPPANEKLVPDVYNVLDAHVMQRTTAFNNMLRYRLNTQERVISKHRRDAVRLLGYEKARAVDSLNRINNKLNAVSRIRDFDLKFFEQPTLNNDMSQKKKRKGYQQEKNEDAVCHRCYIHHLPLKKTFYRKAEVTVPFHKRNIFPHSNNHENATNDHETGNDDRTNCTSSPDPEVKDIPSFRSRRLSSPSLAMAESMATPKAQGAFGWWMPTPQNQQFLWKDKSGREVDMNKGATPRLAPNEEWKTVVKNVCSVYPNKCRKGIDLSKTL